MQTTWHQTNQFVVRNGRLMARPTTPEQRKNYKYIPFDSLNNPNPEDYYRATIAQLQQENKHLKTQLSEKPPQYTHPQQNQASSPQNDQLL